MVLKRSVQDEICFFLFLGHDDEWSAVPLESFACLCVLYAHLLMYVWRFGRGRILDVSDQNENELSYVLESM